MSQADTHLTPRKGGENPAAGVSSPQQSRPVSTPIWLKDSPSRALITLSRKMKGLNEITGKPPTCSTCLIPLFLHVNVSCRGKKKPIVLFTKTQQTQNGVIHTNPHVTKLRQYLIYLFIFVILTQGYVCIDFRERGGGRGRN